MNDNWNPDAAAELSAAAQDGAAKRECEHCGCSVKPSEWSAVVENGQGQSFLWCVSCAMDNLTDSGTLDVGTTPREIKREMRRHAKACFALWDRLPDEERVDD